MGWTYFVLVTLFGLAACQYDSPVPPRPVIPGAIALGGGGRPVGRVRGSAPPPQRSRGFSVLDEQDIVTRPRARLSPQALPPQRSPRIRPQPQVVPSVQSLLAQSKPVIEDIEDVPTSILDDEPLLHLLPSPTPPRPILSEEYPRPQIPSFKPPPPAPKTIDDIPIVRPPPPRPQFRNTIQEEDLDIPTRTLPLEPVRGRPSYRPPPPAAPQPPAQNRGSPPRQQQLTRPNKNKLVEPVNKDEPQHHNRPRKPVVQVIRKYREDNEDGSITWGFENDDGTYKEETIGTDCVTRGKYGYYDPEGVRREFTYSSGIPCERRDQEDAEQQASDGHGYIDYSNNRYVMANGDSVDLDHMVKNRARRPIQHEQYYRN